MDKNAKANDHSALVRTVDKYPIPANASPGDLAQAVQQIFAKPHISKLTIVPGKPIEVEWHHHEGETLVQHRDITVTEALQSVQLEEVSYKSGQSPAALLVAAFCALGAHSLAPCCVVVGPGSIARSWLKIPRHFPLHNHLLGAQVVQDPELPANVLVVLGAASSHVPLSHAIRGVKITMEKTDGN